MFEKDFSANLHECENKVMVARLALFDRGIQVDTEKHLTLVLCRSKNFFHTGSSYLRFNLVGKKKEPHDRACRNLVVKGLAVQVDKRWVHLDVVPEH